MEETYYTPGRDEFFEGFEYEWNHENKGWNTDTFDIYAGDTDCMAGDYYEFSPNCPRTVCRVKYLDKSDIESLGFKHVGGKMVRDIRQLFTLYNNRYFVHINYTRFSEWASIQIETSVEENSVRTLVVHSIRIKNKSELVRLMKQLNIK